LRGYSWCAKVKLMPKTTALDRLPDLLREAERGVAEAERAVYAAAQAGDAAALDQAMAALAAWRKFLSEVGRLIRDLKESPLRAAKAYREALRRVLLGAGKLRRPSWTYLLGSLGTFLTIYLQPVPPRAIVPENDKPPPRPPILTLIPATIQPTAGPNAA
jgi:hypothetical protein